MTGAELKSMQDYLTSNCLQYSDSIHVMVEQRQQGKVFSLENHIAALIYAQLTPQTTWSHIVPHLAEIDQLFFNYNPEEILKYPGTYFAQGIFALKCGNISTTAQMNNLHKNIGTMKRIVCDYGSMDAFVTSAPAQQIVSLLSNSKSKYKMTMLGEALAWEYVRNVGIDGCKPDTHLRRFLGGARMGTVDNGTATPEEVIEQVERLSRETGLSMASVDNIIWSYCADDFGEVCTATPNCEKCVVCNSCKMTNRAPKTKSVFTTADIAQICDTYENDPLKIGEYFLCVVSEKNDRGN